jgi:flagellin
MQESANILQRMRELSIQSANDSNSASDRVAIQKEVTQLQNEINRIADQTTFSGKNLLDGTFAAQKFHVGSEANESITVSVGSARATEMGDNAAATLTNVGGLGAANTGATLAAVEAAGGNQVAADAAFVVVGALGSSGNLSVAAGGSAASIASLVNGASDSTGVNAEASNSVTIENLSAVGTISFTLASTDSGVVQGSTASISVGISSVNDLTELVTAINNNTASTGITATLGATNASLVLTNETGYDISLGAFANDTVGNDTVDIGGQTLTEGGAIAAVIGGSVDFSSASSFSVTATATDIMAATGTSSALSSVADIDVSSQSGANNALNVIDQALSFISDARADLGAVQNRFESTIANLSNVAENVTAARARIMDADFAAETANMTKAQILQQAGVAMLAQANQLPQTALSLLQ